MATCIRNFSWVTLGLIWLIHRVVIGILSQDFNALNIDYKWKLHSFTITILYHIKCFNWAIVEGIPYHPHSNLHFWILELFWGKSRNYNIVNIHILEVKIFSVKIANAITWLIIQIAVISFWDWVMVCHHNSVICFKMSIRETCSLCRWLCKENLRTNQMYIFSNNTFFGQ